MQGSVFSMLSPRDKVYGGLLAETAAEAAGHERSQEEDRHYAVGKADAGGVGKRAEQKRRRQDGSAGGEGEPGAGLVRLTGSGPQCQCNNQRIEVGHPDS